MRRRAAPALVCSLTRRRRRKGKCCFLDRAEQALVRWRALAPSLLPLLPLSAGHAKPHGTAHRRECRLGAGGLPSFTALSFDNMPGGVLGLP
jgi:hypothetical protein